MVCHDMKHRVSVDRNIYLETRKPFPLQIAAQPGLLSITSQRYSRRILTSNHIKAPRRKTYHGLKRGHSRPDLSAPASGPLSPLKKTSPPHLNPGATNTSNPSQFNNHKINNRKDDYHTSA